VLYVTTEIFSLITKGRQNTPSVTTLYEWVKRPTLERVLNDQFEFQWRTFKSSTCRPNDYRYWIISGGSGSGKTRAGLELPNILKSKLKEVKAHCVHIFIPAAHLPQLQQPQPPNPNQKVLRIPEHLSQVWESLSLAVASFYFWQSSSQEKRIAMKTLVAQMCDMRHVIRAIRFAEKLSALEPLVLIVQVDEFQDSRYATLCFLRQLSDKIREGFFVNNHCLILPVLTGTSPFYLEDVERIIPSPTNYGATIFTASPPFNLEESHTFVYNVLKFRSDSITALNSVNEYWKHRYYQTLLCWLGGLPKILEVFANLLSEAKYDFSRTETINDILTKVKMKVVNIYHPTIWIKQFGSENAIVQMLKIAFFEEAITRDTKINGMTIEQLEESGLVFLEDIPNSLGHYRISLSLFFMFFLNDNLGLQIFDPILLDGFFRLDENTFPQFCASLFKAIFRLLTYNGQKTKISIRKLFNNSVVTYPAQETLLDQEIVIQPNVIVDECPEVLERTHYSIEKIESICTLRRSNPTRVNFKEGRYIILMARRSPTVDILVPPNFGVQLKWSAYLASGQPIREAKNSSDQTVYITSQLIKTELEKMANVSGTDDFFFVLISPKQLAPGVLNVPVNNPKVLLVCGPENLRKFSRRFLSDFTLKQVFNQ
jgi:hypothetical protein